MVLHLLEQGIEVVAWNRSPESREEVKKAGAETVETIKELVRILKQVQDDNGIVIWLMLPAGEVTDEMIQKLIPLLSKGDIVIDGANSYYKDSIRRGELLSRSEISFLDIGVSGGPKGARNGACLMIGGEKEDLERIKEVIMAASAEDAWGHFGPVGSGHFAKMVHNGIEYGMMESLAEGVAILKSSPFNYSLAEVLRVYNKRSVIESRLVGWLQEALEEDPNLAEVSSKIGATGEGEWTVKVAQELGVDARVIKDSYQLRVESEKVDESSADGFRNKSVSAMRGKFGGHSVKKT